MVEKRPADTDKPTARPTTEGQGEASASSHGRKLRILPSTSHNKAKKWGAITKARIIPIGNSSGVRLTKEILEESGLGKDDEVSVTAEAGRVIIEPAADPQEATLEKRLRAFDARFATALNNLGK